ncbi:heavy-metal-associated domain-containing protein [Brassicibacter mesophilus]|uniref:heavy-metal-associated domain-containing protein n=1 Tax=Brassicibacter mesophilus TaxID=745119 RepID=UPI003D21F1C7
MKKTIFIEGMSCQHCVMAVKGALSEIAGVSSVSVDLAGKRAEIEANSVDNNVIEEAIKEVGFKVTEIQ